MVARRSLALRRDLEPAAEVRAETRTLATSANIRVGRRPDNCGKVVGRRRLASGNARNGRRRVVDRLRAPDQPPAMSKLCGLSFAQRITSRTQRIFPIAAHTHIL